MLPDDYQCDDVEEFIQRNAKRVGLITYKTPDDTRHYGSGIVFRLGDKLCIQTNYHVLKARPGSYRDVKITIGGEVCRFNAYLGGCQKQDMAILKLQNCPKELRKVTDINQQVVDITVDGDQYRYKGLVEYHRGRGRFVVHALNFIQRRLDDDTEVTCEFMDVKEPATCRMRDVCYCSETGCAIIFLDSQIIPDGAKSMFESPTKWKNVKNPLVVVLSYPGGQDKHISTGRVMHEEYNRNGFPQYKTAEQVCFKIDGDNEPCCFDDKIGIGNSPNGRGSAVSKQSSVNPGTEEDQIEGTNYFFVNSNGERAKLPIIEDVTTYFSCSDYDTKNSPVNRDDNRKYFYVREGQVYCSTDGLILPSSSPGGDQFFIVETDGNIAVPHSWKGGEQNPITFPLLDQSKVDSLQIDEDASCVLGFNVHLIEDKVYFPGKTGCEMSYSDPVYFLVGRDRMVISKDMNDEEMFVQTDMDGNKGFFKLDPEGNKTYVYEPERGRYLLGEDADGNRVYFEEEKDGKKRYYTMQDFQKDQHGSRIFRRTDTKDDQKVYYRNKEGKNNPFEIDSGGNKVYRLIDYNNETLYNMEDTNEFVEIHKVIYLNHNAVTAPGSSGGCVLVIGKDKQNEFQCLVCMHKGKTKNPPVNKAIVYRLGE
ncbi:hypothetical protein SNE40_004025 [Patella caerulea]